MKENLLVVSSAPHLTSSETTSRIMGSVILALLPAVGMGIYFFKLSALTTILIGTASAVATEAILQKLCRKRVTVKDGSAAVTGLLLALVLPPNLPWWIPVLGSASAIVIGKFVWGGLGYNIFNPALVGRAILLASFPRYMTTWINPIDGTSGPTPLALLGKESVLPSYLDLAIGKVGGTVGETSSIALLLGASFLLWRGYISYIIPVSYIGTVALICLILKHDPLFHILAGGLMLGALFMATDMVTSPLTQKGKLIFGIGNGILTMVIRLYGGLPEGVSYSILIMNGFTPLINRYTLPRRFGEVKKK